MPSSTREQQGERNLLQICLDVHQHTTGSSDVHANDQYMADVALLQKAIDTWERSIAHDDAFDDHVYRLIKVTLAEAEYTQVERTGAYE